MKLVSILSCIALIFCTQCFAAKYPYSIANETNQIIVVTFATNSCVEGITSGGDSGNAGTFSVTLSPGQSSAGYLIPSKTSSSSCSPGSHATLTFNFNYYVNGGLSLLATAKMFGIAYQHDTCLRGHCGYWGSNAECTLSSSSNGTVYTGINGKRINGGCVYIVNTIS